MKKIIMSTLVSGALALGAGTANAADIYLCAGPASKTMSDGTVVPMWGFAQVADAAAQVTGCSSTATVPGPALSNDGTGPMTIHLYNDGITETGGVSIIIPGQNDTTLSPVMFNNGDGTGRPRLSSFASITATGTTGAYTWDMVKPGSFIYKSGTHVAVQVQMGLYGAFTQDAAAGQAYNLATAYNSELSLFYSEVDPVQHNAIADGTYGTTAMTSTVDYNPRYFLLNGEDVVSPANRFVAGTAGQTTLLRFFNMGYKNHIPNIQGLYLNVIAEDGNAYSYPKQQYSVLLAAAQTVDALVKPTASGTYAFYDRMLNLTNKNSAGVGVLGATTQTPGSMISFLEVAPAAIDTDGDGVLDTNDNCTLVANAGQEDTDGDGFGNICDGDLSGDGQVNIKDFSIFRNSYGTSLGDAGFNADADFNSDDRINVKDYSIFRGLFGNDPGPAGDLL